MSEPLTKAVAQVQPEQKIKTRNSVTRLPGIASVATIVAVFALLVAVVVYVQDKYSLKSPAESRSPTSADTRAGQSSLPRGLTRC